MRRSGPGYEKFSIDRDYHGFVLYTDGKQFFAEDDNGNESARADTLQALKARLLKPNKVNIKAVFLGSSRGYYGDDDDTKTEVVTVYAVSGAGALLYQRSDGKKDKTTRGYNTPRAYDKDKIEQYVQLCKSIQQLQADKDKLLESWPKLDADRLRNGTSK